MNYLRDMGIGIQLWGKAEAKTASPGIERSAFWEVRRYFRERKKKF